MRVNCWQYLGALSPGTIALPGTRVRYRILGGRPCVSSKRKKDLAGVRWQVASEDCDSAWFGQRGFEVMPDAPQVNQD